jgi:hypothetical protein
MRYCFSRTKKSDCDKAVTQKCQDLLLPQPVPAVLSFYFQNSIPSAKVQASLSPLLIASWLQERCQSLWLSWPCLKEEDWGNTGSFYNCPFYRKAGFFQKVPPHGFPLYIFSHNWVHRVIPKHKGAHKMETGFTATKDNIEGLLA